MKLKRKDGTLVELDKAKADRKQELKGKLKNVDKEDKSIKSLMERIEVLEEIISLLA